MFNKITSKSSQIVMQPAENVTDDVHLNDFPLVSFIIPTLNSEMTLEKCLQSIARQEYSSIEIIIIDGNSVDNTIKIAKKYNIRLLRSRGTLGAVRKTGIRYSRGDLIANWDSDIYIPHKDWLRKAVHTFLNHRDASTLWVYNIPPPHSTLVQKAYNWYSWKSMLSFAKKGQGFFGGGNSIFIKQMIIKVGGFNANEDTGEDFGLAKKLSSAGYKVLFYRDHVYHDTFRSLFELVRKDLRRARNFKNAGLTRVTGIPLSELIKAHIEIGLVSMRNFFIMKETYFGVIPIIVLLRLIVYAIVYILP